MVRDASGKDGDVPQPWVALLLRRLNFYAALSTALQRPTTAALGKVEEVASKQVTLLLQQVVRLLTSDKRGAELQEEQDQLESRQPHLTRWNRAAD